MVYTRKLFLSLCHKIMFIRCLGLIKGWFASLLLVMSFLPAPVLAQKAPVISRARPPYLGYHRYRGTVGGQPVTVELTIGPSPDAHDSTVCQGRYTYDRQPAGQLLLSGPRPYQPRQPLRLTEADKVQLGRITGRWRASQPVGAVISGTWTSPAGKQPPFSLHEAYTDAQGRLMSVSYEVVGEEAKAPCQPEHEKGETKAEYRTRVAGYNHGYSKQFLHLLGPDTLRPSLRGLQCPLPAQRHQLVRTAAREDDGCNFHTASLDVDCNDYGLLAWSEGLEDDFITGGRPQHGMRAMVYDLRTGEALAMADIVRPGTDTLLQRLITQHLLHDDNPDIHPTPRMAVPAHAVDLAPLPAQLFSLTKDGLEFGYQIEELDSFIEGGTILCWVPVPYPDLLPLLRPDSPVARMLRERGLWRAGK